MHCTSGTDVDPRALQAFPVEITREILLLLNPQNIISLQRVSKQFHAIINDRSFWTTLYADSRSLRPLGPFSWHSTEFLQRTLVRSTRLVQRWTSQPMNVLSRRSLKFPRSNGTCRLLCGRWMIVQQSDQFVLRDINTGAEQALSVPDHWSMMWDACCATSSRGTLLYVGVRRPEELKLYEFHADDDSGHLSGPIAFDIPYRSVSSSLAAVWVKGGNTPFVFTSDEDDPTNAVILDTRDHTFYKFPELSGEHELTIAQYYEGIVLTTTYIVVVHAVKKYSANEQLVQVYTIPDQKELHELRLSHQAIIVYEKSGQWSLLRDPVVDPITGSTHLRLLHSHLHGPPAERRFECTDLTLSENSTEDILPISIETHLVFIIPDFYFYPDKNIVEASPVGLARGLCASDNVLDRRFRRFSIDATGERCVGVIGKPHPLWPHAVPQAWSSFFFDYTGGRILYTTFRVSDPGSSDLNVGIVDFE